MIEIRSLALPKNYLVLWDGLLQKWGRLMDDYCTADPSDTDVPYWYGERALTGLLVAAAWRLRSGWGLEEFTTYRGRGPRRKAGRGDAWVGQGDTWCSVECKCQWSTSVKETRWLLNEAKGQLATLDEDYRGGLSLAVCYVVPDIPENGPHNVSQAVRSTLNAIAGHFERQQAVVAIYRPPCDEPPRHEGRCYPGVVFVAEEQPHQGAPR